MQDFGPAASQRGPRGELAAGAASLRSQPGRQDPGDTRWELERESTAAESGPPCPEPATRPVPTAAVCLGHLPEPADSHRSAQCRSHLRIWSPCRQPHCHAGHIEERAFPNRHAHERHAKSPLRRLTEGPRRSRRRAGPARAGGSLLTTAASVLKPRVLAHENLW